MEELLLNVLEEGEWKPLRFTVYNYLEEKELYQLYLEKDGYDSGYDDLEGKTIVVNNMVARQFKQYIERKLQNGNPIVTVCVLEGRDYFTIVKPKNVDLRTVLKME